MKKNNIMKKIIKPFAILGCLFAFASCEVGLGPKVDVIAPTVTVNNPENTGYILGTFTMDGTASDDTGITELNVVVEPLDNPAPDNTYKFRIINQKWEIYDYSTDKWNAYDTALCSIKGSIRDMTWSFTYTFNNSVENGTEFMITTQVFDEHGNESKNSKDERSVTIDNKQPAVSLISPATVKNYSTISSSAAGYNLKDNSILTNLINGEFEVNGSQKEDGKLDKLIVYLDDKTDMNLDGYTEGYILKKEVKGDNLRNWTASFKLYEVPGYEHDKKIVRLITESHDQAGNVEVVCHGWFVYWNDADIPWVVSGFGGDAGPDNNIYANATVVYPSCGLQGQAYDDDGIKTLTIKVYKNDKTTPESTDVLNLSSENYPKYKAWSVNALGTNCSFNVECWCEDIKGNKSVTVRKYMSVKDINPPEIYIETDTTQIMLGDKDGKVTLSGYVTDDGGISSVKLVRIKAGTPSNTIIQYYSSEYGEWDNASEDGTPDTNGNTIWELPLSVNVSTTSGIVKKTFKRDFNIFDDFGIDGDTEKLNTQNFIIMALDEAKSDQDKACAKIDSFTWAGDTHAPELVIEKLYVNNVEKIDFPTYNAQKKSKMLKPFERNADGSIKDTIKLTGTWSDNSTDNWDNKKRHSTMKVEWEGVTNLKVTFNDDGTWTTNSITPPDVTTAIIAMEFKDWAGNIAKANESFFISSNDPELLRITTTENDGSFSANTGNNTVHVILEFNKAVTFVYKDNTEDPPVPTLTLKVPATGTKRTISYTSGNGTTQHVFDYVVHAGENTAALEVDAINANDNTWEFIVDKNTSFPVNNMATFNDDAKKLSASRTIVIDTTAPKIKSITPITSAGSYNKDKEIFIQMEFDEEVTIDNISKLKLNLNSGTGVTSTSAIKTGPKTVLFIYKVDDNHNASTLTVSGVNYSEAGIKDIAKNALATGFASTALTGIVVDTTKPNTPSIDGISEGQCIYISSGATVTITYPSDAAVKKYSINNGIDWQDYTAPVQLKTNGSYTVTAKAIDAAGNESDKATAINMTVDIGNIITSVSANLPSGTYTTNKVIPIVLNFRKEVKVATGSTLTLNNSKTATIKSEDVDTLKTQLVYEYKVAEGDSSDGLNVTAISNTAEFKDENGTTVNDYIVGKIPNNQNLLNNRTIKIVTGKPVVNSVTLANDVLTITFSREIRKGSGNITLEHGTGYKAPSVISEEKFANYKIKSASLTDYYTLGTNGSDVNGNSDLTEKYVLNYATETNNSALITALKAADADKVIVSVNNSNVTVTGTQLKITLSDSYAVPVKGASYNVYIDENVVKDKQSHGNEKYDNTNSNLSVNHTGLEAPVVRVNKQRETIGNSVSQPLQTGVKADCQTPGATVSCVVYRQVNAQYSVTSKTSIPTKAALNLSQQSTQSTYPFNIGDNSNTTNGYIYRINATATKGSSTVTAYEFAYRSVYAMTNVGGGDVGTTGNYAQVWVRGSDLPSGGLSLSTFPVSWNSTEFDKVRAMTNSTGNTWYWVSWEINKPAYLEPLRGDIPDDAATKGPIQWSWGMQCYIPGLANHPLYPGQSITFNGNTNYYGANSLSFYNKHCEYREGNNVIKKKKQ